MSAPIRGRALIINNQTFSAPRLPQRTGSDIDVKNMSGLLTALKFELTVACNFTAEKLLEVICEEAENPHHADYNMFVLSIMSHGKENDCIFGTDGELVKLADVYDLLSSPKFPGMAGKPKLVIIQACSGERRDFGNEADSSHSAFPNDTQETLSTDFEAISQQRPTPLPRRKPPPQSRPKPTPRPRPAVRPKVHADAEKVIEHLRVDDLIVIRSSFESYLSLRHEAYGSLMVRCLVGTFYRHACHRDVVSLCEIVQDRVRKLSIRLTNEDPTRATGQVPVFFSTLTNLRKLYLFPGCHGLLKRRKS